MIKIELLLNLSASKLARFPLRLLWMTPVTFTWLNWRGDLACAAEGAHLLPLTVSSSSRKALKCFTPLGEKDPSIDDVLWASSAISKWESRRILSIATISVERKLLWRSSWGEKLPIQVVNTLFLFHPWSSRAIDSCAVVFAELSQLIGLWNMILCIIFLAVSFLILFWEMNWMRTKFSY